MSCNKIETGSCSGCNVPSILWRQAQDRPKVNELARSISAEYCPLGSGGIEIPVINTVYNHLPPDKETKKTVW